MQAVVTLLSAARRLEGHPDHAKAQVGCLMSVDMFDDVAKLVARMSLQDEKRERSIGH